jgi:tRNA dimethylallyltransferase
MDIGTAKPSHEEQARVPHHLIDIAYPDEILSLAVFQQKAHETIADIHSRNKLPFLVGGTGQYVRAVTEGWTPPEVVPNEALRIELEKQKEENGAYWLHEKLKELDPASAEKIDARNFRRTIRALEVIMTTGKKFSEQRGQIDSPYHLITIGLIRPRPELYARVDARIDAMFAHGFLDEVKSLLASGYSPTLPTLSAIGSKCSRGSLRLKRRSRLSGVRRGSSSAGRRIGLKRPTRIFIGIEAKMESWMKSKRTSVN